MRWGYGGRGGAIALMTDDSRASATVQVAADRAMHGEGVMG
jgi:hypothetical protein